MRIWGVKLTLLLGGFFAAYPTSTNFSIKSYDLGNGGGGSSSSSNYQLNSNVGAQSGSAASSTNYVANPGVTPTQNANVPPAPTLTNPNSLEYKRLKLVLDTGNNPTDTKFAIAISSDNFVTTQFVKSDNSLGLTLALTDYQTYSAWGGASGFYITGLTPGTTYKVKVKAMQGNFTETGYGPATSGVATVQPSLSFGVSLSPPSGPPFSVAFTGLTSGTVYTAGADIVLSITSNAMLGGSVYVNDSNSGLTSASASYTIPSATTDLGTANEGYGAMVSNTSQSSGGPLSVSPPFNGTSNNVGGLSTVLQTLATTSGFVTSGSITVQLKAKASTTTPSATDYADTLTYIASMNY